MRIYGAKEFVWKDNDLYLKEELIFQVVPDKEKEDKFRVKWPDGVLSKDFYNLTWARENALNLALIKFNNNKGIPFSSKPQETPVDGPLVR